MTGLGLRWILSNSSDMADRLIEVLSSPEKAHQMGHAGLRRARDYFSWEAIGDKTVALYQKLVH